MTHVSPDGPPHVSPGSAPDGAADVPAGDDALRERLLRAAAAVFARRGYDGTKIMDVVREAGLSTGAVYGRFRSKNDLLREAVVSRSAEVAHLDTGGVDRVADLIAAGASRTTDPLTDPEALGLEAYVTARRQPEVAAALAESHQVWRAALAPLVDAAQRDGTVAGDVDPEAVLFLVRILHLGLLLHRGSGLPAPDDDAWQALVARIVASFGAGPAQPEPGASTQTETETPTETGADEGGAP